LTRIGVRVTLAPSFYNYALERLAPPGQLIFHGQVVMIPARGDEYLTTAEAAALAGVRPVTIRQWRNRGWLATQGLDERGYPLHTREAVRAAEKRVRENGLRESGIDPRQLRRAA
jgi:hypothetical protein